MLAEEEVVEPNLLLLLAYQEEEECHPLEVLVEEAYFQMMEVVAFLFLEDLVEEEAYAYLVDLEDLVEVGHFN